VMDGEGVCVGEREALWQEGGGTESQ